MNPRGGDIGAGVTSWLGIDFPENVAGIHVSDVLQPSAATRAATTIANEVARMGYCSVSVRAASVYGPLPDV